MSQVQPRIEDFVTPDTVEAGNPKSSLATEVNERSGAGLNRCYQCGACGNGCPFVQAMDYTPNQVIRLLQYGLRQEVLSCKTIWVCVGCHTCSSQCPMGIDLAAVMDTLRLMAVEAGVVIGKPNIIDFHEEVLRSLEKYGRAHKLGIMLGYKRQTGRWLKDLDLGLKLLAKRKLDLIPSRVRDANKEIAGLFPVTGENQHERHSAAGLLLFSRLFPGHHRHGEQPLHDGGGPDSGP